MKITKAFLLITLPLIIISCDCWTDMEGVVFDATTEIPLDSVLVRSFENGRVKTEMLTDSTGRYLGTTRNTGRCEDLEVEFSKAGYITELRSVSKRKGFDSINVYLKRIKEN